MRLLIDLTSVSVGGGVQQSQALLDSAMYLTRGTDHIMCAVCAGSPLLETIRRRNLDCRVVGDAFFARVMFALFGARRLLSAERIDLVYVAFGVGYRVPKSCKQIINVAYPIICYPDSPYWRHLPFLLRVRTLMKSYARAALIRQWATCVVAESSTMAKRLASFARFPEERIVVIPPARGSLASSLRSHMPAALSSDSKSSGSPMRVLFLSGPDQHKNLWALVEAVALWSSRGQNGLTLVLTVTREEFLRSCSIARVKAEFSAVSHYFQFVGRKSGPELVAETARADVIANISDLESVSNNFVEAEVARKPMLIARRDFALASVRVPYIACEPHDPHSIAHAMTALTHCAFELPKRSLPLAISAADRAKRLASLFQSTAMAQPIFPTPRI